MIDASNPLILGSGSPRRRDLVAALGVPFRILAADIDEDRRPGEPPLNYLERIVADKLSAVQARLADAAHGAVLVADTTVVIDDDVLGKPSDEADAARLFARIAGRVHTVYTRYAIAGPREGARLARTVATQVKMRAADPAEIAAYAATREGLDKAGAYAVQGTGSFFIERIEGSYSNVIGLPACEVLIDLRTLGLLPAELFARAESSV